MMTNAAQIPGPVLALPLPIAPKQSSDEVGMPEHLRPTRSSWRFHKAQGCGSLLYLGEEWASPRFGYLVSCPAGRLASNANPRATAESIAPVLNAAW